MNQEPVSLADELRRALARGYCHAKNSHKVLDGDLIEAMREEIESLLAQHAAEPLTELIDKLNADAEMWDNKNDEFDEPLSSIDEQGKTVLPNDYIYGYNSGVSQGFYSAAAKLQTALAVPYQPAHAAEQPKLTLTKDQAREAVGLARKWRMRELITVADVQGVRDGDAHRANCRCAEDLELLAATWREP